MLDPEEEIICPYDKLHKIRRKRMQYHLVKCKRQNQHKSTAICPFNSTHIVDELEFQYHKENCPEKINFALEIMDINDNRKKSDKIYFNEYQNGLECWDDEIVEMSYDPQNYCLQNDILRQKKVATASERREFRNVERNRLLHIAEIDNVKQNRNDIVTNVNHHTNNDKKCLNVNKIDYNNKNHTSVNKKMQNVIISTIQQKNLIPIVEINSNNKTDFKNKVLTANQTKANQTKLEILANLRQKAQKVFLGNNIKQHPIKVDIY